LFEEACRRENLRYQIVGGFSFYERAEVKDTIAYLKLALNPNDSLALGRVLNMPPRGIGKGTVDAIEGIAKEKGFSLWEAISTALREQIIPQRNLNGLKTFSEIVQTLKEKAATLPLAQVVKESLSDTGYLQMLEADNSPESESRLMNLEELVNAAVEGQEQGETLRDFLDHAALVSDTDQFTGSAQVTLMTMHSAKGLEFPVVFLAVYG
jgi:DNA helicase-2/ATP-dependent DNA helicase PcrA